jgi:putative serine/threonine protein kinase
VEEPYASVLCYPKPTEAELRKRLIELRGLRVTAIEFRGEKEAFNLPVLGKGNVGIVTVACRNKEKMALKIRRVDASRIRMQREARMLRRANAMRVGPEFLNVSRDFLLMQFIDGILLPEWLEIYSRKDVLKKVLEEILKQCWRLDKAHLDHGELSRAPKHIIIDRRDMPVIVDFETASVNRRPANVTSICHFLFLGSSVAKKVMEKMSIKNEKAIVEALRLYKSDQSWKNFQAVLKVCNVYTT